MSDATPPVQSAVRRAFAIVFALQGQSFDGLRLATIAQAVRSSQPTTLRTLEVLADEGLAERIPGREEFWRLSPRLIQIAIAHQNEAQRLHRRVDEFNKNYTRTP